MSIQYTMPEKAQAAQELAGSGGGAPPAGLYKPLPHKAGESFRNELYIPLFQPSTWQIFNQDPASIAALGLTEGNPMASTGEHDPEIYTFHFKLPVHSIQNFVRPDGTTGYAQALCPEAFNNYLVNVMGKKPLFKNPSCPICTAKSQAWADHNDRWEALEIDKKSLNTEGYHANIKNDPILKESYERAKNQFGLSEKYLLNVFDYGKLMGTTPRTEDEQVQHQFYLAPKGVFKDLNDLYEDDQKDGILPFFVHENPNGFQIIRLKKDTTQCSASSMRDTEYKLSKGAQVQVDPAWATYMTDLNSMADPSALIMILSHEDLLRYSAGASPAPSMNAPAPQQNQAPAPQQTQAPAPQQNQAPAPQQPAPQQNQAPAPQQPAPQQTQAPAPQQPAPQQTAPQQPAPQQNQAPAPQQPAPQQTAPQQPAPQQTQAPAPQQPAPQQTAPQQPAPQQTAPQQPAPQQTQAPAPQQPAPQQTQAPAPAQGGLVPGIPNQDPNAKNDMTW